MLRWLVNLTVSIISIGCIGAFFFLAPTPPVFTALERSGTPITLTGTDAGMTAFYQLRRDGMHLTVVFDDPLDDDETRHQTSIRLQDEQSFNLVLGRDEDGRGGRRYSFTRAGNLVNIRAEDFESKIEYLSGLPFFWGKADARETPPADGRS